MREAIASTPLYNIILIFMVIVFAFILGIIAYYRAFKINKSIVAIIEKYEGYNDLSKEEIDVTLSSIGYGVAMKDINCPTEYSNLLKAENTSSYGYCVYFIDNDQTGSSSKYYSYGVVTYLTINVPIFNFFLKIPIYSESNRIFRFNA